MISDFKIGVSSCCDKLDAGEKSFVDAESQNLPNYKLRSTIKKSQQIMDQIF